MPKHLIIHGGIHKTGTTSLQVALGKVSGTLRESDILYPAMDQPGLAPAHHALARALAKGGIEGDRIISAFLKQCEAFDGTVVVSSEAFCLLSEAAISTMLGTLRNAFDDVSVVFYLRPQALILRSQYSQQIREGFISISFEKFFGNAIKHARFWKFRELCERWSSIVGEGNLLARSALRDDLIQKDVVRDFFGKSLGLDGIALPKIERNNSLTQAKASVIRKILLESDANSIPFERRRILLRDFIRQFDWGLFDTDSEISISREVLQYCHGRFHDDNIYLSRHFNGRNKFGKWYEQQLFRNGGHAELDCGGVARETFENVGRAACAAWERFMAGHRQQ